MNSKTNQIHVTKPRSLRARSHLTMAAAGSCALLLMACSDPNEPDIATYPAPPPARDDESQAAKDAAVARQNAESRAAASASQSDTASAAQTTDPELAQTSTSSAQTDTESAMDSQPSEPQVSAKQRWDSESQALEQRIRDQLRGSTTMALTEQQLNQIQIQVANQHVTLTGSAPSQAAADEIEQQVEQIPGVSSVDNQIYASPENMSTEPSSQSQQTSPSEPMQ